VLPLIREHAAALRQDGAEAVIVLSHMGLPRDRELAAGLQADVNLIIGAHTHDLLPEGEWVGQVLLAQAETGQGRKDDALKTLEPTLAEFRQRQAQGASDVLFRQRFARALYVQALAEPIDAVGLARGKEALNEADRLLQGLSDEARQLHDSKELMSWITAAQKKLNPDAENKQP